MIESRLLERLERKKAQLDRLRPLPAAALQRLNEEMALEWTYHSNAIEGNTLTLQETRLILETGLTIGGKSLREHLEAINHKAAIAYVEMLAAGGEPLTPFHVRQVHRLVLTGIDNAGAGQYRDLPVRIAGAAHQPPEAWLVPQLMEEWGHWLIQKGPSRHPVERAACAHHRLAAVHPFLDGNGRTARLVMNLLLLRDGYPPTIIQRVNRRQYYRVLEQADGGNTGPLVNFVGRAVERGMNLYIDAGTPQAGRPAPDDEWLSLREAAVGTPYSQEYLGLLARTGRLEARKRGRAWVTTRQAIATYRRSVEP